MAISTAPRPRRKSKAKTRHPISLAGVLRGVKIDDRDIEAAKKSLFKHAR